MNKGNIHIAILLCISNCIFANNIAIIGAGYVGLTLSALLTHGKHTITCFDIDTQKISNLKSKINPIFEPNLDSVLFSTRNNGNLIFTHNVEDIKNADIYFICVPTPTDSTGKCDITYLQSALNTILEQCSIDSSTIVCVKSTVCPGTIREIYNSLTQKSHKSLNLIYNPEFMREGSALTDIFNNNPVVIAGESIDAIQKIKTLYENIITNPSIQFIITNFETAEMIKYGWNSFSAIRIAYINELATLARIYKADIFKVINGLALSEELLPTRIITPGPGFGGSCLPKDTSGFSKIFEQNKFGSSMIHQAIQSNKQHKKRVAQDILNELGENTDHKVVAILGLAFKAHTNDIRFSPALEIIKTLQKTDIQIQAYDPKANTDMKKIHPNVFYTESPYQAVENADCIVILTEWPEIKNLDLERVAMLCRTKTIIDTRNLYCPKRLKDLGFNFKNMGAI